MRNAPLLLLLSLFALLVACGDDECSRICAPGQACVLSNGQELCLEANCNGQACAPGTSCQDNVCVADGACGSCTDDEHCVAGNCVDDYTSDNVCDPLADCRTACGTSASCLAACEADQSNTCSQCLDMQQRCMSSNACDPAGPGTNCCEEEFCACFPSASGCGVPDCVDCQTDCGDDISCFNECRQTDLACNLCLEPLDECLDDGGDGTTCAPFLCDCIDASQEEACP